MERVGKATGLVVGIVVLVLAPLSALAGVVLAPPPAPSTDGALPGEMYAESRFGAPPARPDAGITSDYGRRTAEDLDENESGSRKPAGLQFEGESAPVSAHASASPAQTINITNPMRLSPTPRRSYAENMSGMRRGVQEVALIAGDLGFFPKTVFVTRDIPVRMFVTGASKSTLCIMMDSFQVRKQVRANRIEEITFTPSSAGKYRFYCPVKGMEGSMIVKEPISIADDNTAVNHSTSAAAATATTGAAVASE